MQFSRNVLWPVISDVYRFTKADAEAKQVLVGNVLLKTDKYG